MTSGEIEAGDHSQAPAPQLLEICQIDLCMDEWRVPNSEDIERLRDLIHSEGGIRDPLLVSTAVAPGHWVLLDGFKRLRVAKDRGLTHLWVQTAPLDAAHAKAAMVRCNQSREGLTKLEEARIVYSLRRDHGLKQTQIAQLLKRDEPSVCRLLKLVRDLDEILYEQVKQGTLSATAACDLSKLQRCNQQPVAQAVMSHDLSSRECTRLVQKLLDAGDERAATREVLDNPRRYIDPSGSATAHTGRSDPRLSKEGNRLRSALRSWQRDCSRIMEQLPDLPDADARVLAPLIQDVVADGTRVVRHLETTLSSCSVQLPPLQSKADSASPPAP